MRMLVRGCQCEHDIEKVSLECQCEDVSARKSV